MTDYPLIKSMGLKFVPSGNGDSWIYAKDLERALAAAPIVQGHIENGKVLSTFGQVSCRFDQQTARLLCIQPIERDTAESLLSELLEVLHVPRSSSLSDLLDRARKLLTSIGESK